MKKHISWVAALLMILIISAITQAGTYTSELNSYLANSNPDDMVDAIIYMADTYDSEALKAEYFTNDVNDLNSQRAYVEALRNKITESQADIAVKLAELSSQGQVVKYTRTAISNFIKVTATRTALNELVERADVDYISLHEQYTSNPSDLPVPDEATDGLDVAYIYVFDSADNLFTYLISSGLVLTYTSYDAQFWLPDYDYEEILENDLVIVQSYQQTNGPEQLDSLLMLFVDQGKGVITFPATSFPAFGMYGIYSQTICPFQETSSLSILTSELGTYDSSSPLMEGVVELGNSMIFEVAAQEFAEVVAYWGNDYPLIAINPSYPNVVAINGACDDYGYHSGDMQRLVLNAAVYATSSGDDFYEYLPGDANMAAESWPAQTVGGDVTYLVNYFRGLADACNLDGFYASGDATGDCQVVGGDVTFLVNYFRGLADMSYCADYEPAWLTSTDVPTDEPDGWPNCE